METKQTKPHNPNDPRRDQNVYFYDKEYISKITPVETGAAAEIY